MRAFAHTSCPPAQQATGNRRQATGSQALAARPPARRRIMGGCCSAPLDAMEVAEQQAGSRDVSAAAGGGAVPPATPEPAQPAVATGKAGWWDSCGRALLRAAQPSAGGLAYCPCRLMRHH